MTDNPDDFVAQTRGDLSNLLAELLDQCAEDGMVFPFIVCGISPNGSVCVSRIDGVGGTQILAEYTEPPGFKVPMTIVVVDQNNTAARITIDHEGYVVRH